MVEGKDSFRLVCQVTMVWRLCVHSLELNSSSIQITDFFAKWLLVSIYLSLRCKRFGSLLGSIFEVHDCGIFRTGTLAT